MEERARLTIRKKKRRYVNVRVQVSHQNLVVLMSVLISVYFTDFTRVSKPCEPLIVKKSHFLSLKEKNQVGVASEEYQCLSFTTHLLKCMVTSEKELMVPIRQETFASSSPKSSRLHKSL